MPRYDAVIFDLFGTLVHTVTPTAYAEMLDELSALLGVSHGEFTTQWRSTIEERESGALGDIAGVLRWTAVAARGAPSSDQIASAADRWLSIAGGWLEARVNAREVLSAVRGAGLRVGLLSNCSAEVPALWPGATLGDLFDATVFSCEVGAMKPDRKVYDAACDALDVRPERCMFVGDGGARELTGAAALGMEAVLLRVPGEEHTWFDANYRQDALEWPGTTVGDLSELLPLLSSATR